MKDYKLSLTKRPVGSKVSNRQAISDGQVLGNIFGTEEGSIAVMGPMSEVNKLVKQAGKNHPIVLDVEGKQINVLIREIENETMTQRLHHVTFKAFKQGERLKAEIPVELQGEAPGIREGLILVTMAHDLMVETTPDKLPESIVVDISHLTEDGDAVRVSDLVFDEGVDVENEPDTVIVLLETPRAQVEEEPEEIEGEEAEEGESEEGGTEGDEKTEDGETKQEAKEE